jgi:hypothetical protein
MDSFTGRAVAYESSGDICVQDSAGEVRREYSTLERPRTLDTAEVQLRKKDAGCGCAIA